MRKLFVGLMMVGLLCGSVVASAAEEVVKPTTPTQPVQPAQPAVRTARNSGDIGIHFNLLHEPMPSFLGYGISYHVLPELRVGLSYGTLFGSNFGASLKYFTDPEKPLSLAVGLHLTRGSEKFTGGIGSIITAIFTGEVAEAESNPFWAGGISVGLDKLTESGFLYGFGLEYVYTFEPGWIRSFVPYLQLGWLF